MDNDVIIRIVLGILALIIFNFVINILTGGVGFLSFILKLIVAIVIAWYIGTYYNKNKNNL